MGDGYFFNLLGSHEDEGLHCDRSMDINCKFSLKVEKLKIRSTTANNKRGRQIKHILTNNYFLPISGRLISRTPVSSSL